MEELAQLVRALKFLLVHLASFFWNKTTEYSYIDENGKKVKISIGARVDIVEGKPATVFYWQAPLEICRKVIREPERKSFPCADQSWENFEKQSAMNFKEKYLKEMVTEQDIDDYIDEWHEGDSELPLAEYLGMKKEEYSKYAIGASLKEVFKV